MGDGIERYKPQTRSTTVLWPWTMILSNPMFGYFCSFIFFGRQNYTQ